MNSLIGRLALAAKRITMKKIRNEKSLACSGGILRSLIFITIILVLLLIFTGCAKVWLKDHIYSIDTYNVKNKIEKVSEFPKAKIDLKIGLIADSHFQTMKSLEFVPGLKGRSEAKAVASSLRAVGHRFLSPLATAYLIDKLKEAKVDAILYLGDGAENGCSDEIQRVFDVLDDARKGSDIPIFYVIGNHDYLGAGNTDRWHQRIRLCDDRPLSVSTFQIQDLGKFWAKTLTGKDQVDLMKESGYNLPLNKFEIIKKISEFNKQNKEEYKYRDNYVEDPERTWEKCVKDDPLHFEQHQKEECFITGRTDLKEYPVLLMDTSNYYRTEHASSLRSIFEERIGRFFGTELYGDEGYIREKEIGWQTKDSLSQPKKRFLIVASHYPLDRLHMAQYKQKEVFEGVCSQIGTNSNSEISQVVWVSAHTHAQPSYVGRRCKDTGKLVHDINIGSTIDWADPFGPHAAVLGITEDGKIAIELIKLPYAPAQESPTGPSEAICMEEIHKLCQGEFLSSDSLRGGDEEDRCSMLGLGENFYKKGVLQETLTWASGNNYQRNQEVFPVLNLMRFMQTLNKDLKLPEGLAKTTTKERFLGACISGFASYLEAPKSPKCDDICGRLNKTPALAQPLPK